MTPEGKREDLETIRDLFSQTQTVDQAFYDLGGGVTKLLYNESLKKYS